jgi:hypothetical protein
LYNIVIKNVENKYEYNELIKVFLRPDQFESFTEAEFAEKESNDVDNPQNNAVAKNDVAKKTQKILLPNPTGNNHKKKIGPNAKLKQPAGRPKYIIPLMKDKYVTK